MKSEALGNSRGVDEAQMPLASFTHQHLPGMSWGAISKRLMSSADGRIAALAERLPSLLGENRKLQANPQGHLRSAASSASAIQLTCSRQQ
jgi:hypothetical protein